MDDQNELDLEKEMKNVLLESFEATEKQSDIFVNSVKFVDKVKMHQKFMILDRKIARKKANNFQLPEETFGEVIERINEEGDEFLEWDEIIEFFTRRGRPKTNYESKKKN